MKVPALWLLLALPALAADGPELPEPRPFSDYQRMIEQSPFTLATPVAAPEQPNPFQNFYITGIARIGDKDCVFVASRADDKKYTLFTGEPGPDGLVLDKIELAPEVGRSKVHLRRGTGAGVAGDAGVIEFDQAVMQSASASAAAPAASAPPQNTTAAQPGAPGAVTQRSRIRMINPGKPNPNLPNEGGRQRIRTIPAPR